MSLGRFRFFTRIAKSTFEYSRTTYIKDADPDIPILKEAKAEYAQLQVAPFLAHRCE
jgi:hypothetical protein